MGRLERCGRTIRPGELRRLAKRVKDAAQAPRLLVIAAVLHGASRSEAARIGGMDRQTLGDWVIPFVDQGPGGLEHTYRPTGGRSCPSPDATGPPSVTLYEDWYWTPQREV